MLVIHLHFADGHYGRNQVKSGSKDKLPTRAYHALLMLIQG